MVRPFGCPGDVLTCKVCKSHRVLQPCDLEAPCNEGGLHPLEVMPVPGENESVRQFRGVDCQAVGQDRAIRVAHMDNFLRGDSEADSVLTDKGGELCQDFQFDKRLDVGVGVWLG